MATREDILKIATPIGGSSLRGYAPVENKRIIETVLEEFDKQGLIVDNEVYRIGAKGNQFNGEFRVKSSLDADISMNLIFQNSYNKTMTMKIAAGFYTFACGNGQVYGDVGRFKRKHVGKAEEVSVEEVKRQIGEMEEQFVQSINFKNRMKEIEITKQTISELTGRMFMQENLIQAHQLAVIKQEFDIPQFDYGCENKVWNFYSNITHAYKHMHPSLFIDKSKKLSEFFENEYELCK